MPDLENSVDVAPSEEIQAVAEGEKQGEEVAQEAESQEQDADAKQEEELPKGVKKRFATLTRQRIELENELRAMKAELDEVKKTTTPKKQFTKDDFEKEEDFLAYMVDVELEKRQAKMMEQNKEKQKYEQVAKNWEDKVKAVKERLPDYTDVVSSANIPLPKNTIEAIQESDLGADIAYYLASNPDEAFALSSMSERAQDRYIIRLESKIQKNIEATPKKTTTKAPAPTPKVGANGGTPAGGDIYSLSGDAFLKAWREQRQKK